MEAASARRVDGEREMWVGMSFRGMCEVAVRRERGAGRVGVVGGGGRVRRLQGKGGGVRGVVGRLRLRDVVERVGVGAWSGLGWLWLLEEASSASRAGSMGMSLGKVGVASVWVYTNGGHAPSVSEGKSGYDDTYVCAFPVF